MSALYPDLSLTNFPSNVDQFMTFLNIVASDGPLIAQYQAAMEAGNTTQANQILAQIPQGTQKIITAVTLNQLSQAILAIERFYKTDIEPHIQTQQENWLTVINQFSYQGVWESGTSYVVNNLVSYTVSGLNLVYIATSTPPVGTAPTNTQYWRLLTIQGQQGASGEGLSYRQEWNSSTQYATNDAVTYDGALWMALQASQNRLPDANPQYWQLVMNLETVTYPIQDTVPTNLQVDGLWFNTSNNPTQYYYLDALTNEASANNIISGYQAYDDSGNLLVGTYQNYTQDEILSNTTKTAYDLQSTAVPDNVFSILSKAALLNSSGDGLVGVDGSTITLPGVRIATGSYVGTGTYGQNNPCTLTFDFAPKIVSIYEIVYKSSPQSYGTIGLNFLPGLSLDAVRCGFYNGNSLSNLQIDRVTFSTDGKSVSWYSERGAVYQANDPGYAYYYWAIA